MKAAEKGGEKKESKDSHKNVADVNGDNDVLEIKNTVCDGINSSFIPNDTEKTTANKKTGIDERVPKALGIAGDTNSYF